MKSTELFRQEGDIYRRVMANLNQDEFSIDTHDMGPVVEKMWNDDDYEFWVKVPKNAWGDLLMAPVIELFSGDEKATDKLRDICKKHGVEHDWDSWA